jgi:hypothetical protein
MKGFIISDEDDDNCGRAGDDYIDNSKEEKEDDGDDASDQDYERLAKDG